MNVQLMTMRELHHRMNNGIHVRLLWSETRGQLTVSVSDSRTGASFAVDVLDDEKAMDVFHHPYAYAAFHGIETSAIPESEPEMRLAA
jgi:hypothetical protein